jgi:serine/threonine protein kinase
MDRGPNIGRHSSRPTERNERVNSERGRTQTIRSSASSPSVARPHELGPIVIHRLIGRGTYGRVYELWDRVHNQPLYDRVLKVSDLMDKRHIETLHREVYYLYLLRTAIWRDRARSAKQWDGWKPTVPQLYDYAFVSLHSRVGRSASAPAPHSDTRYSWQRQVGLKSPPPNAIGRGFQVMERMDTTVTELGIKMAEGYAVPEHSIVHTPEQVGGVIQETHLLDEMSVVHADLKRRNLLCSVDGADIRCCDFGFSGLVPSTNPVDWQRFLAPPPFQQTEEHPHHHHQQERPPRISPSDWLRNDRRPVYRSSDLPKEVQKSFWFPKLGFPEALGRQSHHLPVHLWAYLNRYQMFFDMVYNRITYFTTCNRESAILLEPYQVRNLLRLPESIIREFHQLLDHDKIPPLPRYVPRTVYARSPNSQNHSSRETEWVCWDVLHVRGPLPQSRHRPSAPRPPPPSPGNAALKSPNNKKPVRN